MNKEGIRVGRTIGRESIESKNDKKKTKIFTRGHSEWFCKANTILNF